MTAELSDTEELAILLIDTIAARKAAYDGMNRSMQAVMGREFPTRINCIDTQVHEVMLELIGKVLRSDVAAYYLYECIGPYGHGGGITCCPGGSEWKLRNIDDIRRYLIHAKTCPGLPKGEIAA